MSKLEFVTIPNFAELLDQRYLVQRIIGSWLANWRTITLKSMVVALNL
jgi:ribosomal protein S2